MADKTSAAETAEQYGFVQSLFDAIPELKRLFNQAVKGQWTASKFQASLRDTQWWKTHGQSERDYLILQYGDPATAKLKLSQALTQVKQAAAQMGLPLTSAMNSRLNASAYNIVAKGWTSDDLKYYLGQFMVFKSGTHIGGEVGQALDQLHQFSYAMGIKDSDAWYNSVAKKIAQGTMTVEDAQNALKKTAQGMFPGWQKQIEAGQTVADLASPYMQSMAQILEINPGSINLFDPTIKKALQYKDPKTGANSSQPLWDFENTLRNDPRWKQTKNAQDSAMQTAHQVLADFGVVY